ncbi:hypothetical protein PV646_44670 [Streptomyces sp. ID05-26A]|nr:hypothetical protein [Streptomyces sp. ID05-26A]
MRTELLALEQTAAWYREKMAWQVEIDQARVVLPLGRGIVAFTVPPERVNHVRKRLERLENGNFCTPALLRDSESKMGRHAVFLAEPDHNVLGQYQMPIGTRYLSAPSVLPLPTRKAAEATDGTWLCAPDPHRRWLFAASTVLSIIDAVTPLQMRSHDTNPRRNPTGSRLLIG